MKAILGYKSLCIMWFKATNEIKGFNSFIRPQREGGGGRVSKGAATLYKGAKPPVIFFSGKKEL